MVNKNYRLFIIILGLFICSICWANKFAPEASYETCFTPGDNCVEKIVNAIQIAKYQILVQAYNLTSRPIINAFIDAHKRGVNVQILLDKSQQKRRRELEHHHIFTRIDYKPSIAHSKIIIIDGGTIFTGSYNFTKAAEHRNAENLIMIHDYKVATLYAENWLKRWRASHE